MARPLNNAVLLGQMRYYHRIPDFAALLEAHEGSLADAVAFLAREVDGVDDPFDLLPRDASLPAFPIGVGGDAEPPASAPGG